MFLRSSERVWKKKSRVRDELQIPESITRTRYADTGKIPSLTELGLSEFESEPRSVLDFEGGEDEGWKD